jgi:hypothetical protein
MDQKSVDINVKKILLVMVIMLIFIFLWRNYMNKDLSDVGEWYRRNKDTANAKYDLENRIKAFYIVFIILKILLWLFLFKILYNIVFNIFVSKFVSFLKVSKDAKQDMNLNFVFKDVLTLKVIVFLVGCSFVSGMLTSAYVEYMVLPEHMANEGRLTGHIRSIYILSLLSFSTCLAMCFWLTR